VIAVEISEVLEFIEGLTIGYNKDTGERVINKEENPQLIESLKEAKKIIKKEKKRLERRKNLPKRAKEKWSSDEEENLAERFRRLEENGEEFKDIVKILAEKHQRTEGSIRSRLERLV
jgi:hypothetical protein